MSHPCQVCNYFPVPDGEGVPCPHCRRMNYTRGCPYCHQDAPTISRGLTVFCSVCGHQRGPLSSGVPMNLAGKGSKVGSVVTTVAGVVVLLVTLFVALVLGGLFTLVAGGTAGLVVSLLTLLLGGGASGMMFYGSRRLGRAGDQAQRAAREKALTALAATRGGALTAVDAAAALQLSVEEADGLLTDMAKAGAGVTVEIDAQGALHYFFGRPRPALAEPAAVSASAPAGPTGVRVEVGPAAAQKSPEEAAREQVEAEFAQMRARAAAKGS